MRTWAEKRKRELESVGEKELAQVFQLVIKMCELEEDLMRLQKCSVSYEAAPYQSAYGHQPAVS